MIPTIWLIDDDVLTSFFLKVIIKQLRIEAETKVILSGWEALNHLSIIKNSNRYPDIIILDINMPMVNGFDFLKLFEQNHWNECKGCKVVVLSNSVEDLQKAKSLSFQSVVGFIQKPLNQEKFKSGILPFLKK